MRSNRLLGAVLFFISLWLFFPVYSSAEEVPIEVNADEVEYLRDKSIVRGEGNVSVVFKDIRLFADQITVNLESRDATAEGNVRWYQGSNVFVGSGLHYNFNTQKGRFTDGQCHFHPFWGGGEAINKIEGKKEYHVTNGYMTTCDYENPHYRLQAKQVYIYPGDRILFKKLTFFLGDLPVMWLPYWQHNLDDDESPFNVVPGYSNKFGFFLLSALNIYKTPNVKVKVRGDYRAKRGGGGGVDVDYDFPQITGELKTYLSGDHDYEAVNGETGSKTRYRVTWEHEHRLAEDTRLLAELNLQSDEVFIRDFFRKEFYDQIQRENFLDVTKATDKYQLTLFVEPKFNSFYNVLQRLPEARLEFRNQRIRDTAFFYEGSARVGYYDFDFDKEKLDFRSARTHVESRLSRPRRYFDWLTVNPFVGGSMTIYSQRPGGGHEVRGVLSTGVETSTRMSKVYEVSNCPLGIERVRHIIEPTVSYTFAESNQDPGELYQFDLIDAVGDENFFTLSLRNVLQAKDQKGTWELLDALVAFDVFPTGADRTDTKEEIRRNRDLTLEDLVHLRNRNTTVGNRRYGAKRGEHFSDLFFDMKFRPFRWLGTEATAMIDPAEGQCKEITSALTLYRGDWLALTLGQRFFHGFSNQFSTEVSLRINDNWRVRTAHIIDFSQSNNEGGLLERQEYSIIRNLHCWEAALSFIEGQEDTTLFFAMYLKDFPKVRFDVGN